jgi:alanine racemase
MNIGVAAIGYGDGYPRHAPNGMPVLVNGKRAALAGRVSMDMICIDLGEQPDARVGDDVVLWGEGLPADEVAALAGTLSYELLCGVSARVCYDYV